MAKNTPKIIAALILNSENPSRLAAFYRDALGVQMTARGSDSFSCVIGDTHFAIHPLETGKKPTRNVEIGFHVPDVVAFVEELESHDVEIVHPVTEYPWAKAAQVRDPDGNVIYLMQIPESAIQQLRAQRADPTSL